MCVCEGEETISKAQLRLTDIAEHLEADWMPLATELDISPDEVSQIQRDYDYVVEQVKSLTLTLTLTLATQLHCESTVTVGQHLEL